MITRIISAAQTLDLRHAVLRPDGARHEAIFDGDSDASTVHLGAIIDNELVGVASVYREDAPQIIARPHDKPLPFTQQYSGDAWRLRGMAVDEQARGRGCGRTLLVACIAHIVPLDGRLLWCNARSAAVGFYRAAGFETYGAEFLIPGAGPHYVMALRIPNDIEYQ
jgi:ribosomal protein S18 acetylase RimI-like enzyme